HQRTSEDHWVSGRTEAAALEKAAAQFGLSLEEAKTRLKLEQDEDVLDTWFSAALFPFATLGWPKQTRDLELFFPTQLLETGYDILFFWVARMVFFAQELTGQLPFKEVFLHTIVRDAHGRKMSKSLGNVVDPLDVVTGISLQALQEQLENSNLDPREVEKAKKGLAQDYPNGIPECGTDALRFGLLSYMQSGRDINLDVLRIQGYRFFCNKLWNATKFALKYLGNDYKPLPKMMAPQPSDPEMSRWILSRLAATVSAVNAGLASYEFPAVTTALHGFWLYDLCDVYLESLKPVFASAETSPEVLSQCQETLYTCLDVGLRLLSPIMPFVTEELWQRLQRRQGDETPSICVASYPETDTVPWRDEGLESDVTQLNGVVKAVRSKRADYGIVQKGNATLMVRTDDPMLKTRFQSLSSTLATLSYSSEVQVVPHEQEPPSPKEWFHLPINDKIDAFLKLDIKGSADPALEVTKNMKTVDRLQASLSKLATVMGAGDYEVKVPEAVREANALKKQQMEVELRKVMEAVEFWKLQDQGTTS
ncbi:unnamed protein product, partial [Cyprideis torosa]